MMAIGVVFLATSPARILQEAPPTSPVEDLAGLVMALVVATLLIASLATLLLVLTGLLPHISRGSRAALTRSPRRAFLIGLVNYLFLGGISLVLTEIGEGLTDVIALLLLLFLAAVTALGLTGTVALLGQRLSELGSRTASPAKQLLWGTLAFVLAGVFPVLGWFLLAPTLLLLSFGSAVLAWRNRKALWDEE